MQFIHNAEEGVGGRTKPFRSWRGLSPAQLRAVSNTSGKTLVNACAGSGKTATASGKVGGWIECGVDAQKILMLTFTRKAAGEMIERVSRLVGGGADGIQGGTYHSIALRLMREGAFGGQERLGILDQDDCLRIWGKILTELRLGRKLAGLAESVRGLACNQMKDPGEALCKRSEFEGMGREMMQAYTETKSRNSVVDFDDLLMLWNEALSRGEGGRGRWSHVMVDEFQDNSEIQYSILRKLGAQEIFAVGDPNQCIYSFRGSATRLMQRFADEHPECKEFSILTNYRSGQSILNLANLAMSGGEKPVTLRSAGGERGQVYQYSTPSPASEAEFAADTVLWRLRNGSRPQDIAVLFRSRFQTAQLEIALNKKRIPYVKHGGQDIFHAADVKDYLSLLKAWQNPRDGIARTRISLLFPGVGKKSAEKSLGERGFFWPNKASLAGEWLQEAETLGWPSGGVFLSERIAEILHHSYPKDAPERKERVLEIGRLCGEYNSLGEMLDQLCLGENSPKEKKENCITLSTIHSAKGLEWKDVVVFGASDGQLPSSMSRQRHEYEEERRLFYVATTRAKRFLCYTHSEISPFRKPQAPCPFLPSDNWVTPARYR